MIYAPRGAGFCVPENPGYINLNEFFFYFYMKILSVTLPSVTPRVGIMLSKTLGLYLPTCQI